MKLIWDVTWSHHYSGWADCLDAIKPYISSIFPNTDLVGCLDHTMMHKSKLTKYWVGFLHNVPKNPPQMKKIYGMFDLDLERMMEMKEWKKSISFCKSIIVFSKYTKNYLNSKIKTPVSVLKHPTRTPEVKFDIDLFLSKKEKKLTLTGHWMRNFQDIFDIKTSFKKNLLVSEKFLKAKIYEVYKPNDTVELIDWLPNDQYDELLSSSVVFCPLFDCSACNGILDSIVRNTPILLPRLPAAEEYLGVDYPLFYSTLEEATDKIENIDNIINSYEYLLKMDKSDLTLDYFKKSFLRAIGANSLF